MQIERKRPNFNTIEPRCLLGCRPLAPRAIIPRPAARAYGADPHGYRRELVNLVEIARDLDVNPRR